MQSELLPHGTDQFLPSYDESLGLSDDFDLMNYALGEGTVPTDPHFSTFLGDQTETIGTQHPLSSPTLVSISGVLIEESYI